MKYAFPLLLLASATPTFARSDAEGDVQYRVMPGDTLDGIARRGLMRVQDYRIIQQRNRIHNPRAIRAGTMLSVPRRLLRIDPVSAKVVALRGNVMIGGRQAGLNMPVKAGETIRTGTVSFLTMELADETVLTVPSNSRMDILGLGMIRLTGAVEKRFLLRDGRVETQVRPLKRKDDRFEIHTPVSVASVRGTRYRVTYLERARRAGASVLQGAVVVTGGGQDLLVEAGTGVAVDKDAMSAPQALLAAPQMRDADALQDAAEVSFHLAAVPGAASYRAQMATDAGFVDLFAEVDGAAPQISVPEVPDGSFFVRFTAINESGVEGKPASYTVERRRNDVAASVDEASDCPAKRCLLFRWQSNGTGDRRYRFQLVRNPGELPVLDEADMSGTQIVVTDLPAGTYSWRVESKGGEGENTFARWSDYQELRVAPIER